MKAKWQDIVSPLGFKRGDRVTEDYDVGDRPQRTGTVRRVRLPRYPGDRGTTSLLIRWYEKGEDVWPKCSMLAESRVRKAGEESG